MWEDSLLPVNNIYHQCTNNPGQHSPSEKTLSLSSVPDFCFIMYSNALCQVPNFVIHRSNSLGHSQLWKWENTRPIHQVMHVTSHCKCMCSLLLLSCSLPLSLLWFVTLIWWILFQIWFCALQGNHGPTFQKQHFCLHLWGGGPNFRQLKEAPITFFPQRKSLILCSLKPTAKVPCTLMAQHKCLGEEQGRNCDSERGLCQNASRPIPKVVQVKNHAHQSGLMGQARHKLIVFVLSKPFWSAFQIGWLHPVFSMQRMSPAFSHTHAYKLYADYIYKISMKSSAFCRSQNFEISWSLSLTPELCLAAGGM